MLNPKTWLEIYNVFGVGGIISLLLSIAVWGLWKITKSNKIEITKLNNKIETILVDNQDRVDGINIIHEGRMDDMSKSYIASIEKISQISHEDHIRMEGLMQNFAS